MTVAAIIAGVTRARSAILAASLSAALCFPLGYCEGRRASDARCEAARNLANTKALEMDAAAGVAASKERVADVLAIQNNEEELIDAISSVDDAKPDAVRVALGCERLRSQGTAQADIPAICGP